MMALKKPPSLRDTGSEIQIQHFRVQQHARRGREASA